MSIARITEIWEHNDQEQNRKGKMFNYNYRDTLALNDTIEFALKLPSTKMEFLPIQIQCNQECSIDYYMDATVTADTGTPILTSIGCMNQFNPRSTKMQDARIDPTITDYGTLVYPDYVYASQFVAGQSANLPHWIVKPNVWYICQINNQEAQAGTLKVNMYWVED